MLESDPEGTSWGAGVRRAPMVPIWVFEKTAVAKATTLYLIVAGEHNKQVPAERVRELYGNLGSRDKVLVEMGCSSHSAMWEVHRAKLFDAAVQWLRDGKLNGISRGVVRVGYSRERRHARVPGIGAGRHGHCEGHTRWRTRMRSSLGTGSRPC